MGAQLRGLDLKDSVIETTDDEVTVISDKSSGEVEYVLLCQGDEIWVTAGSDQTDRAVETKSIPASKHQLILRCWVKKGGERKLS